MKTALTFDLTLPKLTQERQGNTGTPGVWHFDSGRPGRSMLITCLVHGNELCGAWAVKEVLASGLRPARGRLTLIFCNLNAFDTFDPEHHDASRYCDEDMNRVWSPERLACAGTNEARRARELLPWIQQADWLLDLHSMHEPGAPLLLTGTLSRNVSLARALSTPQHVIVDTGHNDGVRLRDYAQFGDPDSENACALLIECGFHGDPASVGVAKNMIARMLIQAGVCDANDIPAAWLLPHGGTQRVLHVTDGIVAPSMDVQFAQPWQGLETLPDAGDLIGWIDGEPVVTPYDDCTLIMPSLRQLRPGVTVVRLARTVSTC